MIRQLTAKSLRTNRYYVPDHIPDHAVIDPVHVKSEMVMIQISRDGMLYQQAAIKRGVDWKHFTLTYPTNARPLVSRAKREGLYCGKYKKPNIDYDPFEETNPSPVGHLRVGYDNCAVPLRHRKEYVATTAEEVHSILDKIISKGAS